MKTVLLVTQGFPYGVSEQGFLPTEYRRLPEVYRLLVCAYGETDAPVRPLSDQATHFRYAWPEKVSPLGLLRQAVRPEVRKDIALLFKSGKPKRLSRMGWILLYSYRAEQVTAFFRRLVREEKVDMIYTYWCVQATLAAVRLKREFPDLKVVTRFHGMDLYEEQLAQDWQPLRPYIARGCDRLIFTGQVGVDYFLSHWGRALADKASIIHVGCRALPRCPAASDPGRPLVLASCSSVIPIKRVGLIVDMLAALPDSVSVEWHHIGDGEGMDALREHAAKMLAHRPGIRYTLHGALPNEALPQTYLNAGVALFITASETEGQPVSIMEALAMGIPVVATAVGGIPEMVTEGVNGFLMSADPQPAEGAKALQRYIALSEVQKTAMSQAAYECWRKHFDAEQNADRLIRLFNRLSEGEEAE